MLQTKSIEIFWLFTFQPIKIFWLWGAPHQFLLVLPCFARSCRPRPSSRPWATRTTYAPPPQHQHGAWPHWQQPAPRWEGAVAGRQGGRAAHAREWAPQRRRAAGRQGYRGNRFGRESLPRENEGELKYPLWAKRCAPRATRLWPKGAILVCGRSRAGRNGAF